MEGTTCRCFMGVVFFLVVMVACLTGQAAALTLEFAPVSQTVGQGTTADVDVWLREPAGIRLSTYDIFVGFDSDILDYTGTTFSSALGPADPLEFFVEDMGPGQREIVGFPFFFDPSVQNGTDDLLLFTLHFSATGSGMSPLSFDSVLLGDEWGDPIAATLGAGSIQVLAGGASAVPEPGTFLLLGAGIAGLALLRRKRSS